MAIHSITELSEKTQKRFWAKVDRRSPNECWPWVASVNRYGYGKFSVTNDGRQHDPMPHQIALLLSGKERPNSLWALHTCDNRMCCNPAHLYWGTPRENARDMVTRHRSLTGSRNHAAILSELDVKVIRAEAMFFREGLAKRFGVSLQCIDEAISRKTWKHD